MTHTLLDLEKKVAELEKRLNDARLVFGPAIAGEEWACGQTSKASDENQFMVGQRDGTGCGVTNVNWYRTISLKI
jgi:hypothetical protein